MKAPYYQDPLVTIYHGETLELLPDVGPIGALVTDPPYSSGGAFRGDRMQSTLAKYVETDSSGQAALSNFSGDNRDQRSFAFWCSLWLAIARHHAEPGAPCVVFTDWRQLPALTDAVQAGGWVWRNIGTWWKPGIRMQRGLFSASAEYFVFGTNGATVDHDGAPQNVLRCAPVPTAKKEHIAEKPLEVMRWVLDVVRPGSVVVDPFCGSGTTLRAAKDRGIPSIGIDQDEMSCERAASRCEQEALTL